MFIFHFTFYRKHSPHLPLGVSLILLPFHQVSLIKLDHRSFKLCTHIHTYIHIHTHTHSGMYIYVYIYTLKHKYINIYTIKNIYKCIYPQTYIYICNNHFCLPSLIVYFLVGLKRRTLFSAEEEKQTDEKWAIPIWAGKICILKMLWKKSVFP